MRQEAVRLAAQQARDERKRAAAEKKTKAEEQRLLDLIQARGIHVEPTTRGSGGTPLSLADLEPCHPAALHKRLHLDPESGKHSSLFSCRLSRKALQVLTVLQFILFFK